MCSTERRRGNCMFYALWTHHGWVLVPHPESPGPRVRDFLATHPNHQAFYLECTVANPSDEEMSEQRRRDALWHILQDFPQDSRFALRLDLINVGTGMPQAGQIHDELRSASAKFDGRPVLLISRHTDDGWRFNVSAEPTLAGMGVIAPRSFVGGEHQLREGIRRPVERKARGASSLDLPYVVAAQIRTNAAFSRVLNVEVLEQALLGSHAHQFDAVTGRLATGDQKADGVLQKKPAVSAVMFAKDCGPQWARPTLHINPYAAHPFHASAVPQGVECHHVDAATGNSVRTEGISPQSLFGLPQRWPGPEDPFEGINTNDTPGPEWWDPTACA